MIIGADGYWYLVGGTQKSIRKGNKPCDINYAFYCSDYPAYHTVPLVVIR